MGEEAEKKIDEKSQQLSSTTKQAIEDQINSVRKEFESNVEGAMVKKLKEIMKHEAVLELEKKMHEALDMALVGGVWRACSPLMLALWIYVVCIGVVNGASKTG